MLVFRLLVQAGLVDSRTGEVRFLSAEHSVGFSQPAGVPTLVPSMRLIIFQRFEETARLSFISPAEAFALMGVSLRALFPSPADLAELARQIPYQHMIRIAGGAFHLQTAVAFVLSSLILRRPAA